MREDEGEFHIILMVYLGTVQRVFLQNLQYYERTSLVAQTVKRLSTMQETRVRALGWEDPLEKEMAIHSSTIAWKIPWTEKLVGYSLWGRKESDTTEQLHFTVRTKG